MSKAVKLSTHILLRAILISKVGHTDLVLVSDQGSLVGLSMQDYKSLHAVVTICAALVNIQAHTDTQTDSILTSLYEQLNQLS